MELQVQGMEPPAPPLVSNLSLSASTDLKVGPVAVAQVIKKKKQEVKNKVWAKSSRTSRPKSRKWSQVIMDNSNNPVPTIPHDFYAFTHLILFCDNLKCLM